MDEVGEHCRRARARGTGQATRTTPPTPRLFTDSVDVVFAFHGSPGAVHQLVHGRPDADRFHVRGFVEEGTTTPPGATELMAWCEARLAEHRAHVLEHLDDLPEITNWVLDVRPGGGSDRSD